MVVFGVGYIFWRDLSKYRTRVNVSKLSHDNITNNNSFVSPDGSNKSDVNFENGNISSVVPAFDRSLCKIFVGWSLESKGFVTGLCSLICTILMISLYCCICCRVKRLNHRTERQTGIQTSSRKNYHYNLINCRVIPVSMGSTFVDVAYDFLYDRQWSPYATCCTCISYISPCVAAFKRNPGCPYLCHAARRYKKELPNCIWQDKMQIFWKPINAYFPETNEQTNFILCFV